MKEPVPDHEKIRFRRGDVPGWHAYPSAGGDALQGRPSLFPRWLRRTAKWAGLAVAGLVVAVVALFALMPSAGMESEWLRSKAERTVADLTGNRMDARIGRTTLALDPRYFLAIGANDVAIAERDATAPFATAGRVGLGIRFWPLLAGDVEIGSATLSDARIVLPAGISGPVGGSAVTGDDGLIDPDKLLEAVFAGLEQMADRMKSAGVEVIRLRNVQIDLENADRTTIPVTIVEADLSHGDGGEITIGAELSAFDRQTIVSGQAAVPAGSATGFNLQATVADNGKTYDLGGSEPGDSGSVRLGEIVVGIEGKAADGSDPANIQLTASVADSDVVAGPSPQFQANLGLSARITHGAGAFWVDRLDLNLGRSHLGFSGLITPQPATDDSVNGPIYDFRLIGPRINVAPVDSPEPALSAIARLGGWISPDARRIVATELSVATGRGEVIGSGAFELEPGKSPGLSLAIAVARMPVSHAKNLWPFFAAPAARSWVLANVFGGNVENSRLLFQVEPGRFGDGIPLRGDEVSGHFEVNNTRFDVAGTIPPMRDANGTIEFTGTKVDIALDSGTIFTESNRTLDARNGSLLIRDANAKPLIGDVDVEIDGEAAAVTEIAGYDPINLSRYLPISPDGISGMAKGRVLASVPLEDNVVTEDLDWHLELNYEGLSLAEPYEGQRIEDASGTIVADPDQADFVAEAKLNGIRGELTLSEPLGEDKSMRKRQARLFLEPGDTDKLFDGSSTMVSGPIVLDVEQLGPGRESVHADLSGAALSLPWIGWTKAKGVPASTDFVLKRDGDTTEVTDFALTGDGFGGTGSLVVDGDGLAEARFGKVAFNPGDNIALGIDRTGSSYAINVSGQKLDARFLIKEFASVLPGAGAKGETEGNGSDAVNVHAEVSMVSGFHGQNLKGVRFAYAGPKSEVPGLRISATTPRGARTTIVDATAGGSRKLEVKSDDAGAALRFLDIYDKLGGGRAALSLSGSDGEALTGRLELREFSLIDEARLQSMVNRAPQNGERSLNDAMRSKVDVSRAQFDRGSASVELGKDYLTIEDGVVSGPAVGSTFRGTVFDSEGNMSISGTFLPAYGINRIFGEIPLLGQVLGNGRGGGLIGITYRLSGPANEPKLEINPLSAVAPGIFRSIFEYR